MFCLFICLFVSFFFWLFFLKAFLGWDAWDWMENSSCASWIHTMAWWWLWDILNSFLFAFLKQLSIKLTLLGNCLTWQQMSCMSGNVLSRVYYCSGLGFFLLLCCHWDGSAILSPVFVFCAFSIKFMYKPSNLQLNDLNVEYHSSELWSLKQPTSITGGKNKNSGI